MTFVRFGSFTTKAGEATRAYLSAVARKRTKRADVLLSPLSADFVAKVIDGFRAK